MGMIEALEEPVIPHPGDEGSVRALLERAAAFHRNGDIDKAQTLYEEILCADPDHFGSLRLLGALSYQKGNDFRAIELLKRAIRINPHLASAYLDLGNALQRTRQWEMAEACYDAAIALEPDYAAAHNNRGKVLHESGKLEEAILSYRRAIALGENPAEVLNNLGNALEDAGRSADAASCYDRAIAIDPAHAESYWNKALHLLRAGDFQHGLPLYERRWENPALGIPARKFSMPCWTGVQSLRGRTILLHNEQGLGDLIQCSRYAPLLKDLGAHVILEVPSDLQAVMQGMEGVDRLILQGEAVPACDLHCAVLSLPLAFRTTAADVPKPAQLRSDEPRRLRWGARLGPGLRPRIGLAWSGNAAHWNDRNRSVPLSTLAPHLPADCEYVCLQKELRDEDREVLNRLDGKISFHGGDIANFADTAALCGLMDLVVSVDTSVAHLAATLGTPTWILLPYTPDWRWMLHRGDSVWYPSARLIRQHAYGDWTAALAQLHRNLSFMFHSTGSGL